MVTEYLVEYPIQTLKIFELERLYQNTETPYTIKNGALCLIWYDWEPDKK